MIISRRGMIGGALVLPFLTGRLQAADIAISDTSTQNVSTEGMESFDALPEGFGGGVFKRPELSGVFGANPPPELYAALAGAILRHAPYKCRPIDVAYYFSHLREGTIGASAMDELVDVCKRYGSTGLATPAFLSIFAYDWERNNYFNPVVIGFFNGVGLKPYAGDLTPWCATFTNWCISRSRANSPNDVAFGNALRKFGTRDASSGSFRCWGIDASEDPREGDVIVWAKRGTERQECPVRAQGHVAFISSSIRDAAGKIVSYKVVGGNQGYRKGSGPTGDGTVRSSDIAQAVSYRTIGRSFGDRVFSSVRTMPFVRLKG